MLDQEEEMIEEAKIKITKNVNKFGRHFALDKTILKLCGS